MSESNSIKNVGELRDELHDEEITVSCKLLDKNSIDYSKQTMDPTLDHREEQVMISYKRSTKRYESRKVKCKTCWDNIVVTIFIFTFQSPKIHENETETVHTFYDPKNESMWKAIEGDKLNILVLFFLYILQGITIGLKSAVPLVLQERGVSYMEQSKFSISSYPYSMKILWAPIVDAIFIKKFGRRKSWLIPIQIFIGITMLLLSQYVDILIGPDPDLIIKNSSVELDAEFLNETVRDTSSSSSSSFHGSSHMPDVTSLTIAFFLLIFFAATQDVIVDGWALTMLKPKNVGYAATCNSVGGATGWCLGYILYTILDDAGIIDISQFLLFWGIVFIVVTLIIAIFKKEKSQHLHEKQEKGKEVNEEQVEELELGIVQTYQVIWKLLCHPLVPPLILFLFTAGLPFAASESISTLRLITAGVPKGRIARLSIWMIPVKIIMTFIITRYTVGPRPMNPWLYCLSIRILLALSFMVLVYVTPLYKHEDGSFPMEFYILMIFIFAGHQAVKYGMFVCLVAFFARISDPAVGGTNMTFFMTMNNLGVMWPDTFFLWFVDVITYKQCVPLTTQEHLTPMIYQNDSQSDSLHFKNIFCSNDKEIDSCNSAGGTCNVTIDGYYILCIGSAIFGLVWMVWAWKTIKRLQEIDVEKWRVTKSKSISFCGLIDIVINKIKGAEE